MTVFKVKEIYVMYAMWLWPSNVVCYDCDDCDDGEICDQRDISNSLQLKRKTEREKRERETHTQGKREKENKIKEKERERELFYCFNQ
jgi:hypothetical protein